VSPPPFPNTRPRSLARSGRRSSFSLSTACGKPCVNFPRPLSLPRPCSSKCSRASSRQQPCLCVCVCVCVCLGCALYVAEMWDSTQERDVCVFLFSSGFLLLADLFLGLCAQSVQLPIWDVSVRHGPPAPRVGPGLQDHLALELHYRQCVFELVLLLSFCCGLVVSLFSPSLAPSLCTAPDPASNRNTPTCGTSFTPRQAHHVVSFFSFFPLCIFQVSLVQLTDPYVPLTSLSKELVVSTAMRDLQLWQQYYMRWLAGPSAALVLVRLLI
jgi:hypothetical protein